MLAAGAQYVHFKDNAKKQALIPDMINEWVKQADRAGYGKQARELAVYVRKCVKEINSSNN